MVEDRSDEEKKEKNRVKSSPECFFLSFFKERMVAFIEMECKKMGGKVVSNGGERKLHGREKNGEREKP